MPNGFRHFMPRIVLNFMFYRYVHAGSEHTSSRHFAAPRSVLITARTNQSICTLCISTTSFMQFTFTLCQTDNANHLRTAHTPHRCLRLLMSFLNGQRVPMSAYANTRHWCLLLSRHSLCRNLDSLTVKPETILCAAYCLRTSHRLS